MHLYTFIFTYIWCSMKSYVYAHAKHLHFGRICMQLIDLISLHQPKFYYISSHPSTLSYYIILYHIISYYIILYYIILYHIPPRKLTTPHTHTRTCAPATAQKENDPNFPRRKCLKIRICVTLAADTPG